jgi:ParB-like chromosome segregation protein Spo0J
VPVTNDRVEEVNAKLAEVNPMLFGPGARLGLYYARVADLHEQDINANVMPVGMFNALVGNIEKNGALESLALCATRAESPEKIEIVSGHHRIRAARQAGVEAVTVLLYRNLSLSEIRAKQLAHNAIAGKSDPEIVRELLGQIDNIADRMESYIDPDAFDQVPKAVEFKMVDIDPMADAKTVTVVFLPTQAQDFRTAMDLLSAQPDEVYVAHRAAFDAFRDAIQQAKAELDVVATPTAIAAMARLALERLAQLKAEREQGGEEFKREVPAPMIEPDLLAALSPEA